jgi:comE operon protein 1
MTEIIIKNKKIISIIIAIIILIVIGIYFIINNFEKNENEFEISNIEFEENKIENINAEIEEKSQIIVHIAGEILNPGVISLDEGARIIDAINKAGGLTNEADLSKVNLAYILEDAQKIYIPNVNEKEIIENMSSEIVKSGSTQENSNTGEKININTATQKELQKLTGIGESIALRIINYRKENGKFNTIEDIKNVSGIGESKFNKIKNDIIVK